MCPPPLPVWDDPHPPSRLQDEAQRLWRWGDGGCLPRLVWPKEKMQPSAPLTTDWSTSATVPEQTSAWERGTERQAGARSRGRHPASHHTCLSPSHAGWQLTRWAAWHMQAPGHGALHVHTQHTRREPGRHTAHAALVEATWDTRHTAPQMLAYTQQTANPAHKASTERTENPEHFPASGLTTRPGGGWETPRAGPRRRVMHHRLGLGHWTSLLPPSFSSLGTRSKRRPGPSPWGCPPPPPAPSPGGRPHRRQTSWEPWQRLVGGLSCPGAQRPGRTGSPASCVGPPSGRTWTRPRAAPPAPARSAA